MAGFLDALKGYVDGVLQASKEGAQQTGAQLQSDWADPGAAVHEFVHPASLDQVRAPWSPEAANTRAQQAQALGEMAGNILRETQQTGAEVPTDLREIVGGNPVSLNLEHPGGILGLATLPIRYVGGGWNSILHQLVGAGELSNQKQAGTFKGNPWSPTAAESQWQSHGAGEKLVGETAFGAKLGNVAGHNVTAMAGAPKAVQEAESLIGTIPLKTIQIPFQAAGKVPGVNNVARAFARPTTRSQAQLVVDQGRDAFDRLALLPPLAKQRATPDMLSLTLRDALNGDQKAVTRWQTWMKELYVWQHGEAPPVPRNELLAPPRVQGVPDLADLVGTSTGEVSPLTTGVPQSVYGKAYSPGGTPLTANLQAEQTFTPIVASEARGNSRAVSADEFQQLAARGKQRIDAAAAQATPTTGLDQQWDAIKNDTFAKVQQDWGGAIIDAHTGVPLVGNEDRYAIAVREPGMDTISVPEGTSAAEFNAAMDAAKARFNPLLQRQQAYLGVFHDNDLHRIDIDPVMVVDSPQAVEEIGAYTRAVGGAYHFQSGNGFFPPHVAEVPGVQPTQIGPAINPATDNLAAKGGVFSEPTGDWQKLGSQLSDMRLPGDGLPVESPLRGGRGVPDMARLPADKPEGIIYRFLRNRAVNSPDGLAHMSSEELARTHPEWQQGFHPDHPISLDDFRTLTELGRPQSRWYGIVADLLGKRTPASWGRGTAAVWGKTASSAPVEENLISTARAMRVLPDFAPQVPSEFTISGRVIRPTSSVKDFDAWSRVALGTTSPTTPLGRELNAAFKGTFTSFNDQRLMLRMIATGEHQVGTGAKTSSYSVNTLAEMLGLPTREATLDRWEGRLFGLDAGIDLSKGGITTAAREAHGIPANHLRHTDLSYRWAQGISEELADEMRMPIRDAQAARWATVRALTDENDDLLPMAKKWLNGETISSDTETLKGGLPWRLTPDEMAARGGTAGGERPVTLADAIAEAEQYHGAPIQELVKRQTGNDVQAMLERPRVKAEFDALDQYLAKRGPEPFGKVQTAKYFYKGFDREVSPDVMEQQAERMFKQGPAVAGESLDSGIPGVSVRLSTHAGIGHVYMPEVAATDAASYAEKLAAQSGKPHLVWNPSGAPNTPMIAFRPVLSPTFAQSEVDALGKALNSHGLPFVVDAGNETIRVPLLSGTAPDLARTAFLARAQAGVGATVHAARGDIYVTGRNGQELGAGTAGGLREGLPGSGGATPAVARSGHPTAVGATGQANPALAGYSQADPIAQVAQDAGVSLPNVRPIVTHVGPPLTPEELTAQARRYAHAKFQANIEIAPREPVSGLSNIPMWEQMWPSRPDIAGFHDPNILGKVGMRVLSPQESIKTFGTPPRPKASPAAAAPAGSPALNSNDVLRDMGINPQYLRAAAGVTDQTESQMVRDLTRKFKPGTLEKTWTQVKNIPVVGGAIQGVGWLNVPMRKLVYVNPRNQIQDTVDMMFKSAAEGTRPYLTQGTLYDMLGPNGLERIKNPVQAARVVEQTGRSRPVMSNIFSDLIAAPRNTKEGWARNVQRVDNATPWILGGKAVDKVSAATYGIRQVVEDTGRTSTWLQVWQRYNMDHSDEVANMLRQYVGDDAAKAFVAKNGVIGPQQLGQLIGNKPQRAEILKKWMTVLNDGDQFGQKEAQRIHFNFRYPTAGDDVLRTFLVFHVWATRNLAYYPQLLASHPGLGLALVNYEKDLDQQRKSRGLTSRMTGYEMLPAANSLATALVGPGGELAWSPASYISFTQQIIPLLKQAEAGQDDGQTLLGAINDAMSNVGVGLNPAIGIPLAATGALGADPMGRGIIPQAGIINAGLSAVAGTPVDIERPLKDLQGAPDLNAEAIRRRMAEMAVEAGQPGANDKYMFDPNSQPYKDAAAQVAHMNATKQAVSSLTGAPAQVVPKGEADIRQAQYSSGYPQSTGSSTPLQRANSNLQKMQAARFETEQMILQDPDGMWNQMLGENQFQQFLSDKGVSGLGTVDGPTKINLLLEYAKSPVYGAGMPTRTSQGYSGTTSADNAAASVDRAMAQETAITNRYALAGPAERQAMLNDPEVRYVLAKLMLRGQRVSLSPSGG